MPQEMMKKSNIYLIIIILALILGLIFGFPLELKNEFDERVVRIALSIVLAILIFWLFVLSRKISAKKFRILSIIVSIIISLPYLIIITYNVSICLASYYPRWQDLEIYTKNDKKIIYQLRETSGSIYDYRFRKVYYENKFFRVSTNTSFEKNPGWEINNYKGTSH